MNRKKLRKLLDSVADQLTSETIGLVMTLNEIKYAHEAAISKAEPGAKLFFHYDIIKKINKAIRLVSS